MKKMYDAVARCKLTDEFGETIETRSEAYTITAGYCWYPSQAATIDMMINYADFALFRAKALGSIKREFSAEEYVAECNSYSDSKLLTGLIYDNDFSYCFQPIVSTVDGSVYAYEALMRPKTPKSGKKILLERIGFIWNRLSFSYKVTMRNIFRYKRRMLMTIVGIAGCTALVLTGFGVYDSVNDILQKQFGEISNYTGITAYDNNTVTDEQTAKIGKMLERYDCEGNRIYQKQITVYNGKKSTEAYIFGGADNETIAQFVTVKELFCQVVSYYTYNSLMSTSDNRLFADDSKLVSSAFAVSRLVRQVTPVSTA